MLEPAANLIRGGGIAGRRVRASVSHKISRYCRVIIAKEEREREREREREGEKEKNRAIFVRDTTASGLLMHFTGRHHTVPCHAT